jgi:hypothetical protein
MEGFVEYTSYTDTDNFDGEYTGKLYNDTLGNVWFTNMWNEMGYMIDAEGR